MTPSQPNPPVFTGPLPVKHGGKFTRPLRVCFAIPEFLGFPTRGGIGQAYGAFAGALADEGHDITILLTEDCDPEEARGKQLEKEAAALGVRLVFLPELPFRCACAHRGGTHPLVAYRAWHWLKDQDFEVIHFTDWRSAGFFCTSAKLAGLGFQDTLLCVSLRSPSRWCREGDHQSIEDYPVLETDFLEQRAAEMADLVFAPSTHAVDWVTANGWQLPDRIYHQPNLIRRPDTTATPPRPEDGPIHEIVFFGRLQPRKGLIEFCEAINLLDPSILAGRTVTFLGGHVRGSFDSRHYLAKSTLAWPCRVQILDSCTREEALVYLQRPGVLAVIASRLEIFSNTVYECQALGIPFLAANTSSIPELVHGQDHEAVLFELSPRTLAAKLTTALGKPPKPVRSKHDTREAREHWVRWHNDLVGHRGDFMSRPSRPPEPAPRVSVCLVHFNQPELLLKALASLEAQTYPNFEVLIVDDGSTRPDVPAFLDDLEHRLAARGWRLFRQANLYVGAARNRAAREAGGEFLLFMDDDNLAKPIEVETFVRAALHSGRDVVVCPMDCFASLDDPSPEGDISQWRRIFMGGPTGGALFQNTIGDANFFIRRKLFLTLGGFVEIMKGTSEDLNFLTRVGLAGHTIQVVPEALYWYRIRPDSMYRTLEKYSRDKIVISAFHAVTHPLLHDSLSYLRSLFLSKTRTWQKGLALRSYHTVVDSSASDIGVNMYFGLGWHEDEGAQCWMGGEEDFAALLLSAPAIPGKVNFSCHIAAAHEGNSLSIFLNDNLMAKNFPGGDLRLEELPLRPGTNELRFVAKFPPARTGQKDHRKLGFLFTRIGLCPSPIKVPEAPPCDLLQGPENPNHTVLVNELPLVGGTARFGEGWHPDEKVRRWSGLTGSHSSLFFECPAALTITFLATVEWAAPDNFLQVDYNQQTLVAGFHGNALDFNLTLEAGTKNTLTFTTSLPPVPPGPQDSRNLGCALTNIRITLKPDREVETKSAPV